MNILASLFNLAGPDMLFILLLVLLIFGAKKLPELARGMGQAVKEFHKAKDEFDREITKTGEQPAVQPAANTLAQNTTATAGDAKPATPQAAPPAATTPPTTNQPL